MPTIQCRKPVTPLTLAKKGFSLPRLRAVPIQPNTPLASNRQWTTDFQRQVVNFQTGPPSKSPTAPQG